MAWFYAGMKKLKYTCADYRNEMVLLRLKIRLNNEMLSSEERKEIIREIEKLTLEMDMD